MKRFLLFLAAIFLTAVNVHAQCTAIARRVMRPACNPDYFVVEFFTIEAEDEVTLAYIFSRIATCPTESLKLLPHGKSSGEIPVPRKTARYHADVFLIKPGLFAIESCSAKDKSGKVTFSGELSVKGNTLCIDCYYQNSNGLTSQGKQTLALNELAVIGSESAPL